MIFVVLLLPGFAYLVGKERHGTERRASPFRETVAIVAASIASELFVLVLFGLARLALPNALPDITELIRVPRAYLVGTQGKPGHLVMVGASGLVALAAATALAYAASVTTIRALVSRLPLVGPYPHDSTVSAWWIVFEKWKNAREIEVGCTLDDGSFVTGILKSFNNSADDTPERDLVLWPPISYQRPGSDELTPYPASAVCLTASRIVSMFVGYQEAQPAFTPALAPAELGLELPAVQERLAVPSTEVEPAAALQMAEIPSGPPDHSSGPC